MHVFPSRLGWATHAHTTNIIKSMSVIFKVNIPSLRAGYLNASNFLRAGLNGVFMAAIYGYLNENIFMVLLRSDRDHKRC